jgi:hypothetical protein
VSDVPSEPPGNLLLNGSFEAWGEAGPPGWEMEQSGLNESLVSEGAGFHGRIAAAFTAVTPAEFIVLRQAAPAEKPGTYRATLRVLPLVPLQGCRLNLHCLDANGARLSGETRPIRGQIGEWRLVVCDVRPPAGTAAVRFDIVFRPGAAGQLLVDAARLDHIPDPPAPAK